jgi:sugar-phosphatase
MDGLLLDSEVLWHKAEIEIFGSLGVPMNEAIGRSTKGMFVSEVVDYWYSRNPWESPAQNTVVDLLLNRVGDLVESGERFLPGASRALN